MLHLAVDGIGRFGAYLKLILNAGIIQLMLKRLYELGHQLFAVAFSGFQLVADGPVFHRVGKTEIDFLQLLLYII